MLLKQILLELNLPVGKIRSGIGKMKNTKKKVANGGKFNKNKNNNQDKKPKEKCFHCNLDEHSKRNCKRYLRELKQKKKGKFDLLVLEVV